MATNQLVTLNVSGMTCGGCVKTLSGVLKGIAGVGDVEINLDTGATQIRYDPAQTDVAKFRQAIEDAGYDVE